MDPLTFSELRKVQKSEKRQEELTELDDNFFRQVSEYLSNKEELGEQREYNNAKRVFDKIISLREKKIYRQAQIAVKTDLNAGNLNLLPSEQELFREIKKEFKQHRGRIEDRIDTTSVQKVDTEVQETTTAEETNTESSSEEEIAEPSGEPERIENETEKEEEEKTSEEEVEDGYEKVKITSEVPEFMGTDLEPYGPFDEGEKAAIPEENAEILVNRGNAEVVE
ncbi:MAG: DNA replication initiation complex subunit (GINS family) [Candidatus Nanohaloarchaea archaeon]|jgi:DNA replication initiation complex subunit (GINS family)